MNYEIRNTDFIEDVVRLVQPSLFDNPDNLRFTHAILNPPYLKINAQSKVRGLLRSLGLETSNLLYRFYCCYISTSQVRRRTCSYLAT